MEKGQTEDWRKVLKEATGEDLSTRAMKQKVAIARALANDPEVVLMDEPFANLDAQTRLVMREELLRIWERDKKTVILVTHNLEEAVMLCDRIAVMKAERSGNGFRLSGKKQFVTHGHGEHRQMSKFNLD